MNDHPHMNQKTSSKTSRGTAGAVAPNRPRQQPAARIIIPDFETMSGPEARPFKQSNRT
ncbi:MAG TPA: hypothetical protein VG733_08585 [Chthoniobacteraceae bacterium]|nr:hypothetical protein [Chthoniobacteraceae bacterium]